MLSFPSIPTMLPTIRDIQQYIYPRLFFEEEMYSKF